MGTGEIRRIWDLEGAGGRDRLLRAGLELLSFPYRCAVATRNRLYDRGFLKQGRLPCPVISVGNLTVGGTGKTPMVISLAGLLKARGRHPAVLSRGYGGRAKASINIVSDGTGLTMDWQAAGDEPVLIARSTEGVPVLTGPDRLLTGQAALERFGVDCLILDDAFQHRALFRDLDILLLDAAHPLGNGFLLPRGPLRESPEAIHRAHLVIQTGTTRAGSEAPFLRDHERPFFRGIHRPIALLEAHTGSLHPLRELLGKKVCAFAGIGRPESFRESLTELGADIVSFHAYPDHHPYRRSDIDRLVRLTDTLPGVCLITTEKDGVRLTGFPDLLAKVLLLRIGMEVAPADAFAELIFSRLAY